MVGERLHGLDVVATTRLAFAIGVVLYHFGGPWLLAIGVPAPIVAAIDSPFRLPFFFVVSGFLLGYAYLAKAPTWTSFVVRRVARLYPTYLVGILAFLALDLVHAPSPHAQASPENYVAHLLLLQAWLGRGAILANGPGWFIATLLAYCLLLPVLMRLRQRQAGALAFALLAAPVALAANGDVALVRFLSWETGPPVLGFLLTFTTHLGSFTAGLALARWRREQAERAEPPAPALAWASAGLGVAAIVIGLAALSRLDPRLATSLADSFVYTVGLAGLVFAASWLPWQVPRWLRQAGDLSLGLLILHFPWFRVLALIERETGNVVPFPLYLASLLVLCTAYLHLVETPLTRALGQAWQARPALLRRVPSADAQ